jgi:uncharacterized protein
MKITENTDEGLSHQPAANVSDWPVPARSIAPWWHAVLLVAFLVVVSVLSGKESKAKGFAASHVPRYLLGIGWEWVLAAMAWWGIRMRNVPVRQLLGERRSGWRMLAQDFGVAMIFWLMAMILLAALASVLRLMHQMPLQKAVLDLVPNGGLELALWLALCITAGIVEEFVFRGYLLQQFASLPASISSIRSPARSGLWIGVIASSLVFGLSHGYEGLGGMIAITAYGAMFCILSVKRKSLRAGMMAHAWHDSLTGIALAIAKHLHSI